MKQGNGLIVDRLFLIQIWVIFFTYIGYSYTEYKELDSFTEFVIAVVLNDRQNEEITRAIDQI